MSARDLRPLGPLGMLGRAFLVARRRPRDVAWRSVLGALPLYLVVLSLYWVEEVERVRSLRLLVAVALVATWLVRAVALGRAARVAAADSWDAITLAPEEGLVTRVSRTASWTGAGFLVLATFLLMSSRLAPAAVYFAALPLAVRGAFAPGALARSACFGDVGASAVLRAFRDHRGQRGAGLAIEVLLFFAFTVVAVNLYLLVVVALVLGRALVGVDLTAAESFASPSNTFVLMLVAGAALVLLEPIRGALAGVRLVDAQVRQRGLDLRMRVDEAVAPSSRGAGTVVRAAAVLLVVASAVAPWGASVGSAQERSGSAPSGVTLRPLGGPRGTTSASAPPPTVAQPSITVTPEDARTRTETRAALARNEFREDAGGRTARDLLSRFVGWLEGMMDPEWLRGLEAGPSLPTLPGGPVYLIAAALLLALIIGYLLYSYVRKQSGAESGSVEGPIPSSSDPRERPPSAHLDDASRLASEGRFREALRALYLATLVSLDRRRLIRFDTTRTNWQYLRDLPAGDSRSDFAGFTRLFDHKWYGDEPTTADEYTHGRAIAERLCREDAA